MAARYQAVFNGGTGHIINKSFRQLGLALFIDGSCDKELNVKVPDDLEIGDWTQTKKGEGGGLGAGATVTSREAGF